MKLTTYFKNSIETFYIEQGNEWSNSVVFQIKIYQNVGSRIFFIVPQLILMSRNEKAMNW